MKKLAFTVLSLTFLGLAAAQADQVMLNYINTNDCARAQSEVSLLNKAGVQVQAECSDYLYQGYGGTSGNRYNYRLTTYVTVDQTLTSGTTIQLNDIDTDNCDAAAKEISLLNSSRAQVSAVCSPYSYQGYGAADGRRFDYRLYTTVTIF